MSYQVDENGVPIFNREDIERKAEEVLYYVTPGTIEKSSVTPLGEITSKFKDEFKVAFVFDADLGFTAKGNKILGKFVTKPRAIFVDKSMEYNEPRWLFTLAHELGHLVLHRKVDVTLGKEQYSVFSDTVEQIKASLLAPRTPHQWLEWQANSFASSLLMPRVRFIKAFQNALQNNPGSRKKPFIYLDNQPDNIRLLKEVKASLAEIFQTSSTSLEIRMKELNMLIDARPNNIKHAIEFLREE
ncbi:ImmA/IrrE family metallo-endopeptidase [Methylomonas sp. CM2]|uniref:ImmA/IrrE family metallo-endopeptidase n=1 Tax=Methylomonas sp. CM2 TaxID=3417647 RepID=UPI003CF4A869